MGVLMVATAITHAHAISDGSPRTLSAPDTWQPELDENLPSWQPCKTRWQRELSGSAPPIMPDLVHAWMAGFSRYQPEGTASSNHVPDTVSR